MSEEGKKERERKTEVKSSRKRKKTQSLQILHGDLIYPHNNIHHISNPNTSLSHSKGKTKKSLGDEYFKGLKDEKRKLRSILRDPNQIPKKKKKYKIKFAEIENENKWSFQKRRRKLDEMLSQLTQRRLKNMQMDNLRDGFLITVTFSDWELGPVLSKKKKAYWKIAFDDEEISSSHSLDPVYWKSQISFQISKLFDDNDNERSIFFQFYVKNVLNSKLKASGQASMLEFCLPNSDGKQFFHMIDRNEKTHQLSTVVEVSSTAAVLRYYCLKKPAKAIEFFRNMNIDSASKLHHFSRILFELHSKIDLKYFYKETLEKYRANKLEGRPVLSSLIRTCLLELFFPLENHSLELVTDALDFLQNFNGPEVETLWERHQVFLKCLFIISTDYYGIWEPIIEVFNVWLKFDSVKENMVGYLLKSHLYPFFISSTKLDFLRIAKEYRAKKQYSALLDDRPIPLPNDRKSNPDKSPPIEKRSSTISDLPSVKTLTSPNKNTVDSPKYNRSKTVHGNEEKTPSANSLMERSFSAIELPDMDNHKKPSGRRQEGHSPPQKSTKERKNSNSNELPKVDSLGESPRDETPQKEGPSPSQNRKHKEEEITQQTESDITTQKHLDTADLKSNKLTKAANLEDSNGETKQATPTTPQNKLKKNMATPTSTATKKGANGKGTTPALIRDKKEDQELEEKKHDHEESNKNEIEDLSNKKNRKKRRNTETKLTTAAHIRTTKGENRKSEKAKPNFIQKKS